MIRNSDDRIKCSRINSSDDYKILTHNLSNPYGYNFGRVEKNAESNKFQKMHNKVNMEYFK